MRKRDRDALQANLLSQRRLLLKEVADTEADLEVLDGTPEIELEEAAQDDRMRRLLDRLDQRAKTEVEEIDRALARFGDGSYGLCTQCHDAIAPARLRALPATAHCIACASAIERGQEPVESEAEPPARAELPPEYALLTDRELQSAVHEQLAADGRLDLDELRVVCRHGVVYLDGEVPSTTERQILLHTLNDVMGLTAVVERVRVVQAHWQRDDRANPPPAAVARVPWEDSAASEDIVEVAEDGADFEAPDRPPPDEE